MLCCNLLCSEGMITIFVDASATSRSLPKFLFLCSLIDLSVTLVTVTGIDPWFPGTSWFLIENPRSPVISFSVKIIVRAMVSLLG